MTELGGTAAEESAAEDPESSGVAPESAAEELYGAGRDEFIARRGELAKQARAEGDKDAAAEIGRLRKPSVAAWLANLVARDHPDEVGALEELGESLQQAQDRLEGDVLRRLSRQRHELVAALVERGRRIGREEGVRVGDTVVRELERTVTAALSDPAAARALAAGRLVRALEPGAGLGDATASVETAPAPARPRRSRGERAGRSSSSRTRAAGRDGAPRTGADGAGGGRAGAGDEQDRAERERAEQDRAERERAEREARERAERERLERAVEAARSAAERADAAVRGASGEVDDAERSVETAADTAADLRERLAAAEDDERQAQERASRARETRDARQTEADEVTARLENAEHDLAAYAGEGAATPG